MSDNNLRSFLLGLFNTLAPNIAEINWCLDQAHRPLAHKSMAGARHRDIIVHFNYYDIKVALSLASHKSQIVYKEDRIQIFSNLSPITLAKRHHLRLITAWLQNHKVSYYRGFPFQLVATKDGIQNVLRDIHKGETFFKSLGLPHLPKDDLPPLPSTLQPPSIPSQIWTQDKSKSKRSFATPQ